MISKNIYLLNSCNDHSSFISEALKYLKINLTSSESIETFISHLGVEKPDIYLFIIELTKNWKESQQALSKIQKITKYQKTAILFIIDSQQIYMKLPKDMNTNHDFVVMPLNREEVKSRVIKLITTQKKEDLFEARINSAQTEVRRKNLNLETMVRINQSLSSVAPQDLAHSFVIEISGAVLCTTAVLFIKQGKQNPIFSIKDLKGIKKEKVIHIQLDQSKKIIQRINDNRNIQVVEDIIDQLPFNEILSLESLNGHIIVPIDSKGELIGLLMLGEKITNKEYTQADLDLIRHTCTQFASSFTHSQLQEVRSAFSRYVSKEMIDFLMENPEFLELGGVKRKAVVMFADIRNFTSISEKYPPEAIVNLLNTFYSFATEIIFDNGGMLDKYIGDCIMAEWGIPIPSFEDIEKSLRTALEIQKRIETFNLEVHSDIPIKIEMGIAIHYGDLISGNLGSESRMDYTVIGDTVNVASRIEDIAGPGEVVVSAVYLEPIKNYVDAELIGDFELKGKSEKVTLYRVNRFYDEEIFEFLKKNEPHRVQHFFHVSALNVMIGKKMGFNDQDLREFKLATLLLDIGRPKIDRRILTSKKKLTQKELNHIRQLPKHNAEILQSLGNFSEKEISLLENFHEKYDGTGYPHGKKGKDIPLWARICRVTDTYVALTQPRPFREKTQSSVEARAWILENSGKAFDHEVVKHLMDLPEQYFSSSQD